MRHEKAIALRQQGFSIGKIAEMVGASKSTVSLWVRSVKLTDEQTSSLNDKTDRVRKMNKVVHDSSLSRRMEWHDKGWKLAQEDDRFRVICALYWGEGSKSRDRFSVANCDPNLLSIAWLWLLDNGYGDKVSFYALYHNSRTEDEVKKWWRDHIPGLNPNHFRKFIVKKDSKGGKWEGGIGNVRVFSTNLRSMVQGGIEWLVHQYSFELQKRQT